MTEPASATLFTLIAVGLVWAFVDLRLLGFA